MQKLLIIGGGITGLSSGCYAQMKGFSSQIFEQHNKPGGLCTSWKRGEYTIDGSIHWMIGCKEGNPLYPILKELGIIDNTVFYSDELFKVVIIGNRKLNIYSDISKFEKELVTIAPEDKNVILKFTGLVRKFTDFSPPLDKDFGNYSIKDYLNLSSHLLPFLRYKRITLEQFCSKFKNEFLREAFFQIMPVKNIPMIIPIFTFAFFHNKDGGFPLGGSLKISRILEKKYKDSGGIIHYNSRVEKILIKENSAYGIKMKDQTEIYGDVIISCADGNYTLKSMIDQKYIPDKLVTFCEKTKPWDSVVYVAFGINHDFRNTPKSMIYKLDIPVTINGSSFSWFGYCHYSFDKSFAPKGKSVLIFWIPGEFDYWHLLYRQSQDLYIKAKGEAADFCKSELNRIYPGIVSKIEMTDVATPVTWWRYTGNYKGSIQGWEINPKNFGTQIPKKLPNLRYFYMASQWTILGGGVPSGMVQGKNLIEMIEKELKS